MGPVALIGAFAILAGPAASEAGLPEEIAQMRAQVERTMKEVRQVSEQVPKRHEQAAAETARAKALRAKLAKLKEKHRAAQARVEKERAANQELLAKVTGETERGGSLAGFKKRAWDHLIAESPSDPIAALVSLFLKDEAKVSERTKQLTGESAGKGVEAFEGLVGAASAAAPNASRAGAQARPAASAGSDDAFRVLDRLAESTPDATSCSAVDTPAVKLPGAPPSAPSVDATQSAITAFRKGLSRLIQSRRSALDQQASASAGPLRSALGSPALASDAARAAVRRGFAKGALVTARRAIAGLRKMPAAAARRARYSGAMKAFLKGLEKETGFGCWPTTEEGR